MKLTRQQELALIDIGLTKLLESLTVTKPKRNRTVKKTRKQWTPEQRLRFSKSMRRVWKQKKAAQ